jgi:cytoskeletal protein RodZ
MQFLIYFAVVGPILLSVLFFASSTQKRPAEDRFFVEFKKTETSRPHSTQRHATKPTPAPKMTESAPEMATAPPEMATGTPDVAKAAPETTAAAPDVATAAPETTASAPDVAAAPSEMATTTPDVAATAPDTTSVPLVAGQPTTHLVPKVVTNVRAEAVRKYPRDDPRNPIWWLWGLSNLR